MIHLKKASDSVSPKTLLQKLYLYGVRGIPILWFKNYLKKSQFKKTNGLASAILDLIFEIQQGTIFCPLIFL